MMIERNAPNARELQCALLDLRALYDADHAECERAATIPSRTPPDTCRYCGKFWKQSHGSKIDGHARCIVSDGFKRTADALLASPYITNAAVAEVLGVSVAVVRSWSFA